MALTLIGDFADPLSYLASQRVEQIRSLGLHDVQWLAVEADRTRPLGGSATPNSRAATAAYAESLTDGVADAMRRALFDAFWMHGRNIGDPEVVRAIVYDVLNPQPAAGDIDWRIRANLPLVPLGGADPITASRRLGLIVSMGRGPLTIVGQERIDTWRRLWQQRGSPELPLLLTDLGEACHGGRALTWLDEQLPTASRITVAA